MLRHELNIMRIVKLCRTQAASNIRLQQQEQKTQCQELSKLYTRDVWNAFGFRLTRDTIHLHQIRGCSSYSCVLIDTNIVFFLSTCKCLCMKNNARRRWEFARARCNMYIANWLANHFADFFIENAATTTNRNA